MAVRLVRKQLLQKDKQKICGRLLFLAIAEAVKVGNAYIRIGPPRETRTKVLDYRRCEDRLSCTCQAWTEEGVDVLCLPVEVQIRVCMDPFLTPFSASARLIAICSKGLGKCRSQW
jgi:hypothetical protein